jgi:hypothetical protein
MKVNSLLIKASDFYTKPNEFRWKPYSDNMLFEVPLPGIVDCHGCDSDISLPVNQLAYNPIPFLQKLKF